jgi:hypothetical protein
MYLYSELMYGQSFTMKGSAHPTLFVDSFANFGGAGVFVGVFWLFLMSKIYSIFSSFGGLGRTCFLVISSYSIPLILRGSVYYGALYLILGSAFILLFLKFTALKRSISYG